MGSFTLIIASLCVILQSVAAQQTAAELAQEIQKEKEVVNEQEVALINEQNRERGIQNGQNRAITPVNGANGYPYQTGYQGQVGYSYQTGYQGQVQYPYQTGYNGQQVQYPYQTTYQGQVYPNQNGYQVYPNQYGNTGQQVQYPYQTTGYQVTYPGQQTGYTYQNGQVRYTGQQYPGQVYQGSQAGWGGFPQGSGVGLNGQIVAQNG